MRARISALVLLAVVGCDRPAESTPPPAAEAVANEDARVLAAAPVGMTSMPVIPDELPPDQPSTPEVPVDVEIPVEPDVPVAPDDYGLIRLPVDPPPIEELTMHGLAGYEVVAIYAKPSLEAERLGYLRLGARMKVTERVEGSGCAKGWHALENGGFACASRGLVVDDKPPYMRTPPSPPAVDDPLPYRYGYVRKWNTPMYWRIPSAQEQAFADTRRRELEAIREGTPTEPEPKPTAKPEPKAQAESGDSLDSLPAPDGTTPDKAAVAEPEPTPPEPAAPAPAPEPEIDLPLSLETPWLEKGFFVSLDETVSAEDGKDWWHTARGAYVEAAAGYEYTPKDFSGQVLPPDTEFPFGFAMVKTAKVYALDEAGKLSVVDKLERRTFVDFEAETEIGGTTYLITTEGTLLRKKDVRLAEAQPLPKGLQEWERWIDVSLDKQMLVAYEGERPVYVTLVSTGKKGTAAEPFDTPTGRWRIRSKHVSTTMDGGSATDGNYSIQDVPWTMYFHDSYALHGAFWHESFGRVRSHGCVNLGPSDARWLFLWTTPFLPEGWHGVHAHEGSPGTTVVVRQ